MRKYFILMAPEHGMCLEMETRDNINANARLPEHYGKFKKTFFDKFAIKYK